MTLLRTAQAMVDVPGDGVDLGRWLFELSDADYQACARGHRAAGSYTDDQGHGTVNVESIGGNMIIHHYRAVRTEPALVEMRSARSRVYLLHLVPVTASVGWTLTVTPVSASTSLLTCTVGVTLRPVPSMLGRLMASGTFLNRHVAEETAGFAMDISRKHPTSAKQEAAARQLGRPPKRLIESSPASAAPKASPETGRLSRAPKSAGTP